MAKMRHWKQNFTLDAPLRFRKRMHLNCCGVDTVQPGDPVTDEMREFLGAHRLKMWWRGEFIEIDEAALEDEGVVLLAVKVGVEHTGKGWYTVTLSDGTQHRVRGKAKAEALLNG